MKKLLRIVVLGLILGSINTPSSAYTISKYYWGKGDLKISKNVADELEYYFSSGKLGRYAKEQKSHWVPFFFVISPDGKHSEYYINPHGSRADVSPHYIGQAKQRCKKKSGQECFVFANGYKIVWQNGINNKRKLKKKEIMAGKTFQILQELGFYDGGITKTKKIEKKKVEKKKKPKKKKKKEPKKKTTDDNNDIVQQIKDLKELYDSGVLTKEEFEKAKKKLLN